METIDLKELFEYFKSKLSIIILITVIVAILGCLYGLVIQRPMYKSETSIILVSDKKNEVTFNDINLNKNLVGTYTQIIKSRRVLDTVIEELNLDTSYEELYNNIEVSSLDNTEIIKISVNNKDASDAKNIANKTANVFAKEVPNFYSISNVNVLDKAIEASHPYNINVLKQAVLSVLIGGVLAGGIVFMMFYFDRSIKNKEQIEKLGLVVLGTVQDYTKGASK